MTPEELAATQPAAAPEVDEPRPEVLDMDPARAARELATGKPCPVCGAPLKNLGADKFVRSAGALALGWLGALFALVQPSCRCDRCGFETKPNVAWAVFGATMFLWAGAMLALMGLAAIHSTGQKPIVGIAAILAAIASPFLAYRQLKKPGQKIVSAIASGRARWEEEHEVRIDADALLAAARPGNVCPVCGKAALEGPEPNPLWERGNLRCPKCRLDVPVKLTQLAFGAGFLVAGALVVAGAYALLAARDAQGNDFMLKGMLGIVLAIAGVYLGVILQGAGDEPARKELEIAKRRHERRSRGLASRDEDEPGAWFQENLEAVVVAVILALVIRHFVMEAFVIPTGSMAPTLFGDHFEATCENCRYHFAVAKSEGDMSSSGESVTARCPLCGHETQKKFYAPDVHGGNKILVNKFLYKLSEPDRFNVIVFKFPRNPSRNFIKRLVGLPGEWIKIDGRGDLKTKKQPGDPWVLARKPKQVQDELWMPVYDSRYPDPRRDEHAWKEGGLRWSVVRQDDGEELEAKPGTGETWIEYAREIKDYYGYNKGWQDAKPVGDVRLRATVVPGKDAKQVKLALVENDRTLAAVIPVVTDPKAYDLPLLTANGVPVSSATAHAIKPLLRPGVAASVEFSYADERATLAVDGEEVLDWDDPKAFDHTEKSSVSLGVDQGGATFRDVKIDRDVFYVHGGREEFDPSRSEGGVKIPDHCYFAMGDNSPNSQDGREWGFVHEPHMIGRAFLVFWPLWQVKLIR